MARSSAQGTGTSQELVRRHNLGTLLGHVHRTDGISRAALTESMGLNRSTIGHLVRELEEVAAVTQTAPRGSRSGAGRPSYDVLPAGDDICVLAAELGVDTMDVARVGLGGRVLDRVSRATPASHRHQPVVKALVALMQRLLDSAGPHVRLVGVGVAIPGVVSDADGLVRVAPNLEWTDVPLAAMVSELFGVDVRVRLGNDAELGALSEHTRGAGRGREHLIYLSGDVGVGGGVIMGGVPMMGASGYAGEIGHQPFDPKGALCRCGNVGCWETAIGSHAVADAIGCSYADIPRLPELLAPEAKVPARLRKVGRALGSGLGGLVNVFNPEVVILGGVLRFVLPMVEDDVRAAFKEQAMRAPGQDARIVVAELGGDSVIVGAAELAFTDLMADPLEVLTRASGPGVARAGSLKSLPLGR